jgi:hypothetical protein
MALLTALGEGETDGEGLLALFELGVLPGSVAQPAMLIASAVISPRVVRFIVLISEFLGE